MKIAYVASEAYPFIKTGGIADVVGSLPKFIAKEGIKIIVCIPLYKKIDIKKHGIVETDISISVNIAGKQYEYKVYKYKNNVKFYFFYNKDFFGREGIYGTESGEYEDNYLRFGTFSYAVLEFFKKTNFIPDIIHINSWQPALIPILKEKYGEFFKNTKTIQTVHNIAYQGVFPKKVIDELGLDRKLLSSEFLEHKGKVNFLKGGIILSDAVTTVSPTYLKEICTPEYGFGLDAVLRENCHKLFGILNGIDYSIWNPEKDPYIYQNYSYKEMEKKRKNKEEFLKETGLKGKEKPLLVFIGKFKEEHGVDILIDSLRILKNLDANFAILGHGNRKFNRFFEELKGQFENIYIKVAFDEPFSRKMYAAADFLIKPSLYEPCGLSQMIAMRYGTVVIARKTGGLADTIRDISEEGGYGILFDKPKTDELVFAIERSLNIYRAKEKFENLSKYVSTLDFSWDASAAKYIRLYESLKFG